MKKIVFAVFLLIISSCVDEFVVVDELRTSEKTENLNSDISMTRSVGEVPCQSYDDAVYSYDRESDSLYIESLGWKITKMYEDSISYLVNGEILFLKDSLLLQRNSIHERLFGHTLHIDHQHILFSVNEYINTDVSLPSYFSDAVNEWNSLVGCNLYFGISDQYEYNTRGWFDVTVEIGPNHNYNPELINQLEFGIMIVPTASSGNNVPAIYMYINPAHESFEGLSDNKKKYAIMHAIGHLIGLQDAESSDNLIMDSEWSERTYTIMNESYIIDDQYGCDGFSSTDKDNLAAVYPIQTSVIHDVNQKVTSDSHLPPYKLRQYKAYEFSSVLLGPKRGNENLYCEYEVDGPAEDYDVCMINDTTARITFNTTGTYSISARLKSNDIDGLDIVSNTIVYEVINDVCYLPNVKNVTLNKPFIIQWVYSDEKYPDAEIVVIGEEYLFGDGDKNVDINNVFNGKVSVTLGEYGCYRITMSAITPTYQVLKTRSFLIREFWRPGIWVVQNETEFPFTPHFTETYSDEISERPMQSDIVTNGPGEYIMTIGGNYSSLQHNFYADLYMSYLRQYEEYGIPERRLDVRMVTEDAPFGYIKRNAGNTKVTYGPLKPVVIVGLSGSCGVPEAAYGNYYGHQVLIIPEDYISVER